jgi:hypothetical protein
MKQAALPDGFVFDPFPFQHDGLAASEVDVGRGEIAEALVVSAMIVVLDEGGDLPFEIAGQEVVFEQDAVLERLVPALDLALGLGMTGSSAGVIHALIGEPGSEVGRHIIPRVIGFDRCEPIPAFRLM